MMIMILCLFLIFFSVIMMLHALEKKIIWLGATGSILLMFSCIVLGVSAKSEYKEGEEYIHSEKLKDEELKVPVLFSEADGCKVYKYKDGEWHRFVRCSPKDVVICDTK